MAPHQWNDPNLVRTVKSFLKAWYWTIGVFLLIFVIFHIGAALYGSYLLEKVAGETRAGIATDFTHLKVQGDAIAADEHFKELLLSGNSSAVIDFLQKEREARAVGLMGAYDAQGIVIARTKTPGALGENNFLTTPQGRALDKNGHVESIEATSFDPRQLAMFTGREVLQDGVRIGGLSTNYLFDDTYLRRFRDEYLPASAEVVSYTAKYGMYGESFTDPATRSLITSYFTTGSEWIQKGLSGKTVSFGDNSYYLVLNSVAQGLEASPGGLLIFIPRKDISPIAQLVLSLFTLVTFISVALYYHLRSRREERGWRYWVVLLLAATPVFFLALSVLYVQNSSFLQLKHTPYALYNSTLRLQPEWGIFSKDFEQRIAILVEKGDEAINAVDLSFSFDPQAVTVKAFDTASSSCAYIVEEKIDAAVGEATFSCVLQTQTERRSTLVTDLIVVPARAGMFSIVFNKTETKVFADDGLATNVLRMAQDGSYQVQDFSVPVPASTTPLTVFSPTHPNQARWYNMPAATFLWRGGKDAIYFYTLDNSPDTIPAATHSTQSSSIELPLSGDGIFYFHLRSAKSETVHYKIQVDRTPPYLLALHASTERVVVGDVVRFSFEAEDVGSGIQQNFYIDLGSQLFLPVGREMYVPFLKAGNQTIILRVYDDAGNYTDTSTVIHVENN